MNYSTIEEAWGDLSGRKKKKRTQVDPICELYNQQTELTNLATDIYQKKKTEPNTSFEDAFTSLSKPGPTTKSIPDYTNERFLSPADDDENYNNMISSQYRDPRNDQQRSDPRNDQQRRPPPQQEYKYSQPPPSQENRKQPQNEEIIYVEKDSYTYREREREEPPVYRERESIRDTREIRDQKEIIYYPQSQPQQECKQDINNYYYSKQDPEYDYYKRPSPIINTTNSTLDLILYIISGIILIFLLDQFVRIGINMKQYSPY